VRAQGVLERSFRTGNVAPRSEQKAAAARTDGDRP